MKRVQQLLSNLCQDLETQVKSHLRGTIGDIVHGYLPQVWVFETECSACTLFLDTEGYARVFRRSDSNRDVTILWRSDYLESVLASRNRDCVPLDEYPNVTIHTDKGRAAFNYLKKEIGL